MLEISISSKDVNKSYISTEFSFSQAKYLISVLRVLGVLDEDASGNFPVSASLSNEQIGDAKFYFRGRIRKTLDLIEKNGEGVSFLIDKLNVREDVRFILDDVIGDLI